MQADKKIFADNPAVANAYAAALAEWIESQSQPKVTVSLSGGSTPNISSTVDGGSGSDFLLLDEFLFSDATIDLSLTSLQQYAVNQSVTLTSVESVAGAFGDDTLLGSSGANTLIGNQGNDILRGRAGDDTLIAGERSNAVVESNTYDGGDGQDVVVFDYDFDFSAVSLSLNH